MIFAVFDVSVTAWRR